MAELGDIVYSTEGALNITEVLAIAEDDLYFPVQRSNELNFTTQLIRCRDFLARGWTSALVLGVEQRRSRRDGSPQRPALGRALADSGHRR